MALRHSELRLRWQCLPCGAGRYFERLHCVQFYWPRARLHLQKRNIPAIKFERGRRLLHAEENKQLQNNANEFQKPDRILALPVFFCFGREEHIEQDNKAKYNDFDLRYRHNIVSVSSKSQRRNAAIR